MRHKKGQAIFSNFVVLIIFLAAVFAGGISAGVIYFDLNTLDTVLHTVNFPIPIQNNASIVNNVTDFQGILGMTVFPLLTIKDALPYLSYFMVFGFIIAMGVTAYVSTKNPVFFVLHILFLIVITYFSFILSNSYVTILQNPLVNQFMTPFTIYNKLMIYLPQVIFFTGLLFGVIAFINPLKPQSASGPTGLNYGGDY